MRRPARTAALVALVGTLAMVGAGDTAAHGHPAPIDDGSPDAWKFRLCSEMSFVALQALHDRDKGRPPRHYAEDGGPGPAIANAIVRKVYEEPGISSPKRAEAFGRGYCNEQLQK